MGNLKNAIPKQKLKKKRLSTLIRVIKKNKNSPKESRESERERKWENIFREREREIIFLCGKI